MRNAKYSLYFVGFLVIVVSITHYQEVFSRFEAKTITGEIVSWTMGVIFDLSQIIFVYYYRSIESKWKIFYQMYLLLLIFFLHLQYYIPFDTAVIRTIYASCWPFCLAMVSFLVKHILKNSPAENQGNSDDDEITRELQEILGDDYAAPPAVESKPETVEIEAIEETTAPALPPAVRKPGTRKRGEIEKYKTADGRYECPGCSDIFESPQQMSGHKYQRCLENRLKREAGHDT